jgi:hypothetical protein
VRIQIAVALIAFLLLRLAQAAQKIAERPARLCQAGSRQSDAPPAINRLLVPEPITVLNPAQLVLQWN